MMHINILCLLETLHFLSYPAHTWAMMNNVLLSFSFSMKDFLCFHLCGEIKRVWSFSHSIYLKFRLSFCFRRLKSKPTHFPNSIHYPRRVVAYFINHVMQPFLCIIWTIKMLAKKMLAVHTFCSSILYIWNYSSLKWFVFDMFYHFVLSLTHPFSFDGVFLLLLSALLFIEFIQHTWKCIESQIGEGGWKMLKSIYFLSKFSFAFIRFSFEFTFIRTYCLLSQHIMWRRIPEAANGFSDFSRVSVPMW